MKLGRKQKIKRREQRARRHDAKLKADLVRIFAAMGVHLDFDRLPGPVQLVLLNCRSAHPTVKVDFDGESPERIEDICWAVLDALDNTTFPSPSGQEVSAPDFVRYCIALRDVTPVIARRQWAGDLTCQMEEAANLFAEFCDRIVNDELSRILFAIDTALCGFSRLDSAIYWYTPDFSRGEVAKRYLTVTIHKQVAEMVRLTTDRGTRPAYRVGGSFGLHGRSWAGLPKRLFGVDSDEYFPVYIQDHALLRLHERLPLEGFEGEVHDNIWLSFVDPKLTVGPAGDRLVEYQFCGYKLGYFPVEVVDGKVLIKTFLFITMTGTPEARLLYKNLGLVRRDIEELSFDSIETFHNTDVLEDEELRSLLATCGCGHLLEMVTLEDPTLLKRGRARQIRHYLGMKTI
jgi:hypothetical protein